MPIVDLDSLKVGQLISYQSKDIYDTTTHLGTIKAIGDYETIRTIVTDILPTYSRIRKQDPTMPDINSLEFLVLELTQDEKTVKQAVAKHWLEPTSVQIVDYHKTYGITLYDLEEAQVEEAISVLRLNGFKCAKT